MRYYRSIIWILFAVTLASAEPIPPKQPATGPGGSNYSYAKVTKTKYGNGPKSYWLFEPAKPVPQTAPVIVFNHGWSATKPQIYGAWIEHLVRRGNIVIYPIYQQPGTFRFPPKKITPNAIQAVKDALEELKSPGHVKPNLSRFAIVGHSAGGLVAANMAALAISAELPRPKAVMSVQPGKTWAKSEKVIIPLQDMSSVAKDTLLLTVVGDKDRVVRDIDAKKIFYGTTNIPLENKDYVIMVTDSHGKPNLVANHLSPTAPDAIYNTGDKKSSNNSPKPQQRIARFRTRIREGIASRLRTKMNKKNGDFNILNNSSNSVNALDYYGTWKLFDILCDSAFYGNNNKQHRLENSPHMRYMGKWSDGTPVKELIITDSP